MSEAECPVCRQPLAGGPDTTHICPQCSTPHHLECWVWIGGCATYGCEAAGDGPPESAELAPLLEAPLPTALLVRSVLASSGIPSLIEGEHASTFGIPLLGVAGLAKVLTRKTQLEEAREALLYEGVEGVEFGWDLGEEP